MDYVPIHIPKKWAVSDIQAQLSWNIYYKNSDHKGGEIIIHNTEYNPDYEDMKEPGEYYYPYNVLKNDNFVSFKPKVGDFIIFNTKNFHEVKANIDGERFSQSSFVGLTKNKKLKMWS